MAASSSASPGLRRSAARPSAPSSPFGRRSPPPRPPPIPRPVNVRRVFTSLALLSLATAALGQAPAVAIRAGVLIDGKSASARRDQVIVVRGNRIESVSDAAKAAIPAGATVLDLSRATVLPGLIDCHTHIFLQGEEPSEGGYD